MDAKTSCAKCVGMSPKSTRAESRVRSTISTPSLTIFAALCWIFPPLVLTGGLIWVIKALFEVRR
ncbi:unnamed protein product [Hymenolepis diminuta]|uniref:Uncharacterized protein n=1 Tax=Hymenolepis diminuta TaxID=6216 RepID=A0A564XWH9_HYMDI|nr:unnamed protein product [Hymenolepis diminuta]